ncbi:NAD(P)-binding domain-containing protein [Candidatus Parcubacteria bacterium]|nr:NAD(P)-binding domain-containing protein [Candidatus Parcubacteria bacterium]
MKKVAILGTGMVGQVLASGFKKNGFEVIMGTQTVGKKIDWKDAALKDTKIMGYKDAAKEGELIVFTMKGTAAEKVAEEVANEIAGKTVIDTTNPIKDAPPADGMVQFFTSLDDSLMERLQRKAPKAHFVKAFSSVGSALMVDPKLPSKPTMFIAGNDASAKKEVTEILEKFGWETEDMGAAPGARAIEPLCILWCIPGFMKNDWVHAFKMLR